MSTMTQYSEVRDIRVGPATMMEREALKCGALAESLKVGANVAELLVVVVVLGGVLAGMLLGWHQSTNAAGVTSRPLALVGAAVAVGAMVLGLFGWMGVRTVRLFAAHLAFQYRFVTPEEE